MIRKYSAIGTNLWILLYEWAHEEVHVIDKEEGQLRKIGSFES